MCGSGVNLTDVCPNGLLFKPLSFLSVSKAWRGSLYEPGAGTMFFLSWNRCDDTKKGKTIVLIKVKLEYKIQLNFNKNISKYQTFNIPVAQ